MRDRNYFETVDEFLACVGRASFQEKTGFSTSLVTRAKTDGAFPSHWFWRVREFCEGQGHEVPERLFKGHPDNEGRAA